MTDEYNCPDCGSDRVVHKYSCAKWRILRCCDCDREFNPFEEDEDDSTPNRPNP